MFMLDTDICSYIIKRRPLKLQEHFEQQDDKSMCISVITEAELLYGLARSPEHKKIHHLVMSFIRNIQVKVWDRNVAQHYAVLRAHMQVKGKPSGNLDLLIAAHALSLGATLVTSNTRHFAHVPKLKVVNWV